jgi:hypothetical protein
MTCPHFSISIRSRYNKRSGNRGSAVAGAAYQSAEKLFSEYDSRTKNYSYKQPELIFSEIMLPENAPPEYSDRATLWNAVEKAETRFDAQLSRGIIAALPTELPFDQSIQMVKEFCQENFVSKGMCCDIAVHDPAPPGHNPHVHIMLTMRGIDENGKWLPKSRKEYILDEKGQRIRLPSGEWKSRKVDTVDWNKKENAEVWRASWEAYQNRYLERNHCPERVSLKSYKRQGIDQIPTEHMGPAASAMEKKGIETDIGNLNREIRQSNSLLKSIKNMIRKLADWIGAVHEAWQEIQAEEAAKPKPVYLGDLLQAKLEIRKAERSGWSHKAQTNGSIRDLQKVLDFVDYLNRKEILTVGDLNDHLSEAYEKSSAIRKSVKMMEMRARTIAGIRKAYDVCRETKAVHDQYVKIGWKSRKEKFRQEHADELNRYEKADRFLRKNVPDGKIDFTALSKETAKLEKELAAKNEELAAVQADLKILKDIRYFVKELLPELAPDDQTKTQEKRSIHEQLEKNRRAIQENDAKRNPALRQKGTGRDEI